MGRTASKRSVRSKPKARHHRRRRKPKLAAPQVTAIVKGRERVLSAADTAMIRTNYAKNATDEEFLLFMTVCKKHLLDPFTGQAYCVIFEGERTGRSMVIITGIGGYRAMAARSHRKEFGGTSGATWTYNDSDLGKTPAGRRIPETATVYAYRKGDTRDNPSGSATVFWEEFAPANLRAPRSDFWNRMPKHMLAKCAESHALRKAFPDLSNIYSTEEMSQRLQDLTPGGRNIVHAGGVQPSGRIVDGGEEQAKMNAKLIAEAKQRGDWCEKHHCVIAQCPADEHTNEENEAIWERQKANLERHSKTLDVQPESAKTSDPKPKHKDMQKFEFLRGTVHRCVYGKTSAKKVPYIQIRINQTWHTLWSKTLQQYFKSEAEVVAHIIECWVNPKTKDIEGLRRIGDLHFQDDGRTPIVREPGEEGD